MKGVVKAGRVLYHEGDAEKSPVFNNKTLLKTGCIKPHSRPNLLFPLASESCKFPSPLAPHDNCISSSGVRKAMPRLVPCLGFRTAANIRPARPADGPG